MFRCSESAPTNSIIGKNDQTFVDSTRTFGVNKETDKRAILSPLLTRRTGCGKRSKTRIATRPGKGTILDFVRQLVSGVALGCAYGLIGPNGVGKRNLLAHALGEALAVHPEWTQGYRPNSLVRYVATRPPDHGGAFCFTLI
jgi:hypothetical protein